MKFFFLYFVIAVFLFLSCDSSKHVAQSHTHTDVSKIIKYAGKYIGVPYKIGGVTPSGFDCSGFTQYVFNKFNHRLPRSSMAQSQTGIRIDKNDVKVGDLIFFTGRNQHSQTVRHVGIVIDSSEKGCFLFIHASTSKGVTITSSLDAYYKSRYLSARRII